MKIKRTLQISENEFYDYLEGELIRECQLTKTKIEKGLNYKKTDPKTQLEISVFVINYIRGTLYEVKISSSYETYFLKYTTQENENGLEIQFEQHIESFEIKKQNRLMRLFSEGVYLGRMSDTLFDIQKKVHEKRRTDLS
ncbi:DUF3284 domain-containing protein [Listeria monocytogenes]|nr:DUF3284 domain-containing protein [Listeria monocytogenes]EAC5490910.1 DUF3284 domain-containing protein [Listeria monocytogenes]EAC9448229.1 DUF3284 domain-containing protein [Listeria monocytogenes]EAC9647370.1 DUF3284 domain-containing protein [Listeria monocytogenes]EAC9673043.1 DUF3284 domain-containing protein [Listeria monocytogenes]